MIWFFFIWSVQTACTANISKLIQRKIIILNLLRQEINEDVATVSECTVLDLMFLWDHFLLNPCSHLAFWTCYRYNSSLAQGLEHLSSKQTLLCSERETFPTMCGSLRIVRCWDCPDHAYWPFVSSVFIHRAQIAPW